MAQRIKGQETVIGFTSPDGDEDTIGDVQSMEFTLDIEALQEGYLGETADRFDDIYHGVTGTCELHWETSDFLAFSEKVQDRSERRTAASGKFTITTSFAFPNGTRARVTFQDVFWGEFPVRIPSRGEYVAATLNWRCSRIKRVL